jgi:uncharacterized protein (TIRG00374 family)
VKDKGVFSRSNIFFFVFSAIIFILVIYYFAEIKKDIKLLGKVNVYWLVLAFVAQFGTYLFGALVYYELLRIFKLKLQLSIWKLIEVSIVTLFFNQTVPSAGISGNTFFFNFLARRNVSPSHIIPFICIELLTFYGAMEIVVISLLILCFFLSPVPISFFLIFGAGLLVYAAFAVGIGVLGRKKSVSVLYKKIATTKFAKKFLSKLTASVDGKIDLEKIKSPLHHLREHKIPVVKATVYQLFIFIADSLTIFILFQGLGVPQSIVVVFIALMLTKIISILPVSPGAVILYESGMTFFFVGLGVPLGTAIIVTLLYRVLSFWLPILLGFILYRKFQLS